MSSRLAAGVTWPIAAASDAAVGRAGQLRQLGQVGVLGEWQRRQHEGRVTARHGNAIGLVAELDPVLRQGADNLHEEAARHQEGARLRHLGPDPDPR